MDDEDVVARKSGKARKREVHHEILDREAVRKVAQGQTANCALCCASAN